MGRGLHKNKINWVVIENTTSKERKVHTFHTMRELSQNIGINADKIYYLSKRKKKHNKGTKTKTRALLDRFNIIRVKNDEELLGALSRII